MAPIFNIKDSICLKLGQKFGIKGFAQKQKIAQNFVKTVVLE